jgi:hypothetical protein
MRDWRGMLRSDPADWLLEESNPSVRYLTLTRILDLPDRYKDARKAKKGIMESGAVPAILAKQQPDGNWEAANAFYTGKYRSTVWQLIILAEHAADAEDARIKRACEFILEHSQDRSTGGFAYHTAERTGGGRASEVIPCLTGNMIWSLRRLGYENDPRVRHGIEWLAKYLRFDDGETRPPEDWPYNRYEMCYGRHSCLMGVAKGLKALAEIPEASRSKEVKHCIDNAVEFLLKHHVFKRSHDPAKVSKPSWKKFGFPKMWQTDVVEILLILTKLGVHDKRMQEAVDLVISKQDEKGCWRLEDTFNGRFQVNIEAKGKRSKWVTLNALTLLKRYHT